jgi:hypothetical protein
MEQLFIFHRDAELLGVCETARDAEAACLAEYDARKDVAIMSVIAPTLNDAWRFLNRFTWKPDAPLEWREYH